MGPPGHQRAGAARSHRLDGDAPGPLDRGGRRPSAVARRRPRASPEALGQRHARDHDTAREQDARAFLGRGSSPTPSRPRRRSPNPAHGVECSRTCTGARALRSPRWRSPPPRCAKRPTILGLLSLAIDCGFAVGANEASTIRLERLRSLVGESAAWETTLSSPCGFRGRGTVGRHGADGALVRARVAASDRHLVARCRDLGPFAQVFPRDTLTAPIGPVQGPREM